ncbi:circularly permuted type 2 ATP-grasp protein, partial [Roseateles sp. GG27B]
MKTSFDEMHSSSAAAREHYKTFERWLARQSAETMRLRREEAELIFRRVGITFAVYGDKDAGEGTERLIPFDLIPRVIPADEWAQMQAGLIQRVTALNRFIHDVYHDQDIIKADLINSAKLAPGLADLVT